MRPPATPRSPRLPALLASAAVHGIGMAAVLYQPAAERSMASWRAAPPHRLESTIVWDCPLGPAQATEAPLLAVVAETSPPEPVRDPPEPSPSLELPPVGDAVPIAATQRDAAHLRDPREWRTPVRGREALTSAPQPTTTAMPADVESPAPSPTEVGEVAPSPLPGQNEPPRYPFVAWRRGIEGTVVVELAIDATGNVASARVDRSSGCVALDEAARTQLLRWRFTPARGPAGPVTTTHRQAVVFRIHG